MMRARLLLVALATLVLSVAGPRAQTGNSADGVDALLRRDYARAAAILKPLAETPWQPDHTAEFFMAVLYESGLGVPQDPLRACALFVRASIDHERPLGTAASALVRARHRTLDREAFNTCNWRASVGFDDRFEPVTFMLDQEHWIAFDLKGTTIAYRGVETRIDVPLVSSPVKFVSIRHAELAAGATFSMRRHFVDIFKWVPLAQARTWRLSWTLFEVVRDELVSVTSQQLITATGDEPPVRSAIDLESLVRLRVNDAGDPEFSVLTGAARQTTVIESDAERTEWKRLSAQQSRANQDAARADPKRVLDVHRRPSLAYSADGADGCGNAFVYGWTADRTEAISVRADKELLQISTGGTFDLATQTVGLDVRLHVYERAMRSSPFCTDVGMSGLVEEVWRPTRGTVTIQLSPAGLPVRAPGRSRATIRISGAQFVSPAGVRVDQTPPITLTAIVGSIPG
jgi:hypothetical protein